jgi:uncharacterized RDD family membrane protein YckC
MILAAIVISSAIFALMWFPVTARLTAALVSPYPKADLKKRFAAAAVDALLAATCALFYWWVPNVLFFFVAGAYTLLRDAMFIRGQSVGKFLMGLTVIRLDTGQPSELAVSARRNFFLIVPGMNAIAAVFEVLSIARDAQGHRLGDRIAQTQVVEGLGARELVSSLMEKLVSEIEGRREARPLPEERYIAAEDAIVSPNSRSEQPFRATALNSSSEQQL